MRPRAMSARYAVKVIDASNDGDFTTTPKERLRVCESYNDRFASKRRLRDSRLIKKRKKNLRLFVSKKIKKDRPKRSVFNDRVTRCVFFKNNKKNERKDLDLDFLHENLQMTSRLETVRERAYFPSRDKIRRGESYTTIDNKQVEFSAALGAIC